MEYLKYLFTRYDYLEVQDSFLNAWSFDMMIFLSIVFLILIIIFRTGSKKKAIQILKENYPDEKVVSVAKIPNFANLFFIVLFSYIDSVIIMLNLFFKNLPVNYCGNGSFAEKIILILFAATVTIAAIASNGIVNLYTNSSAKLVIPNKLLQKYYSEKIR